MNVHRWSTREGNRGIRSFVNVRNDEGEEVLSGRFEGYVFSGARHTGIGLSTDDDTAGVQLYVGLAHLGNAWVTVGSPALSGRIYRRWKKSLPDVDVAEVKFHDRAVWWSLWHSKWSWSSKTPRWRKGAFHWWDWLTGKPVYRSEVTDGPRRIGIPMPEGVYEASITMSHDTWKRPRWPWPQERNGYDIKVISRPGPDGPYDPGLDPPNGYVPVPGKGENSWDCGGDGTFGQSGSARTVEQAIGDFVAGALRERQRHAGRHDYAEPIS